ncbi:MAG: hypothetical protein LBT32_02190 [Peptococcaceae bacterium]|jgi:hypothetical protein|nr:hypothetical protein [Peptococcaceae bacterium]
MKNIKCHICNYENESADGQATLCVACGAELADPKSETKLMEAITSATCATSDQLRDVRKECSIYLTDRRLIVIPADVQFTGLNLTGILAAKAAQALHNKMTSNFGVISIPVKNIKTVRDGKFGLLVKAIIVETTGGEMVKITVPKRDEWKSALANAAK